jgi:hypothetical protein
LGPTNYGNVRRALYKMNLRGTVTATLIWPQISFMPSAHLCCHMT